MRSETDFFKGVVAFCAAGVLVAVLALAVDAAAAAIVAAALIGVGAGLLLRGSRGSMPDRVPVASRADDVHRVLVVANETIEGEELLAEIENRTAGRPDAEILLVCPALAGSRLQHLASTSTGRAPRPRRGCTGRSRRSGGSTRTPGAWWATTTRSRPRATRSPPSPPTS
ncbi:MAG: hypothetical protein U0R24_00785 [Solirubrobacterales bacterium]